MDVTTPAKNRVLIMGQHEHHRRVEVAMEAAGLQVLETRASSDGLWHAVENAPHIVVLRVDMPGEDWMDLLCALRGLTAAPIIVIGLERQGPLVEALERGADICLTPQVSSRELLAYIRALLRRHADRAETGRLAPLERQVPAGRPASGSGASWLLPIWG